MLFPNRRSMYVRTTKCMSGWRWGEHVLPPGTWNGGSWVDLLQRSLEHDRWTTRQYLELSRDLTDAQLDQEFDIGLRTLRDTFDHIIFNVAFWTGQMAGQPIEVDRSDRSIPALIDRHERYSEAFASVARQIHDGGRMDETFVDHFGYEQSQGTTIIHVLLHNAQHRSEVLHILRRLGVTDLIEGDPQEWEHMTGRIASAAS